MCIVAQFIHVYYIWVSEAGQVEDSQHSWAFTYLPLCCGTKEVVDGWSDSTGPQPHSLGVGTHRPGLGTAWRG